MKTTDLPIEERMRLYNEVCKIRRELGFGSHRIAKILGLNKGVVDGWLYNGSCPEWVRIKFIPNPSKELAYVLGVVFGDASVWKDKNNNCHIDLKTSDREFVEKFAKYMAKVFNKSSTNLVHNTYDGYWKVTYGSRDFYKFRQILTFDKLLVLIKNYEIEFLQGLFDSEGSVHIQANSKFDILVGLSNVNKELLEIVSELLKTKFDINSYIVKSKAKGSLIQAKVSKYFRNKDVWRLQIHDMDYIKIFLDKIGFSIKRKQEKLKDALEIINKFSNTETSIIWRTRYKIIGREWQKILIS